jgi:hypothetical protein
MTTENAEKLYTKEYISLTHNRSFKRENEWEKHWNRRGNNFGEQGEKSTYFWWSHVSGRGNPSTHQSIDSFVLSKLLVLYLKESKNYSFLSTSVLSLTPYSFFSIQYWTVLSLYSDVLFLLSFLYWMLATTK